MDFGPFLLRYPVFLLGRYAAEAVTSDPSIRQWFAITDADGQPALLVFTGSERAERMMMEEGIAANIIPVETPAELADIIHANRQHFGLVLIDPDPSIGIGRGFPVDQMLRELRQ